MLNRILSEYKKNIYSQGGEDGVIEKIFDIVNERDFWCVEFGAADGQWLSNSKNLIDVFYSKKENIFKIIEIGEKHYSRLTVPPNLWFGFKGTAYGRSLLMNVADLEHNPDEVLRTSISEFIFDWRSI